MKKLFFTILLIQGLLWAQNPILDVSQDTLYILNEHQLLNQQNEVVFTTKGNILFNGNSSSYKNIKYTIALDSYEQKKAAKVYNNKGAISDFTIQNSMVYYQYNNENYSLATFVLEENTWAIYNNLNDSLLAYFSDYEVSNADVFAVFIALFNDFELKKQLINSLQQSSDYDENFGVVEPVFGNGTTWIWDGKYLYPYGVNLNHVMVWEFDGEKLKPRNYPRTQEEWAWDGSSLKPYWGGNPQNQWTWQNGVLRQIWNNNYQNEYFIEGNVIRKRFGSFGDNEWEMKGNVPLPIITAIVLGVVYR